jgi:transporter family-2 protein
VLVAGQSRINAELTVEVGSGFTAAWISFGVGLLTVGLVSLVTPAIRSGLAAVPGIVRSGGLRWWQLLGGVGGAWLVTTQGLVVPVVGVTLFMVSVVAGQVLGSLLADRFGLSPAGVLPISARRAAAALLAGIAVVISAWPQLGKVDANWVLVAAIVAGGGVALQQAVNGRVASTTGQPFSATTINFLVGLGALTGILLVQAIFGSVVLPEWPSQWWLYLGGPIGVLFIALAAWAVKPLGVLAFGLLAIAGQVLGALTLDLVLPSAVTPDASLLVGLLLLTVAVVLAATATRPRG